MILRYKVIVNIKRVLKNFGTRPAVNGKISKIFFIQGSIELMDSEETFGDDELLGIIGVFTKDRVRLDTAIARTHTEVGVICVDKVSEIMLHEPALSRFLLQCLAERLARKAYLLSASYRSQYPAAPATPLMH